MFSYSLLHVDVDIQKCMIMLLRCVTLSGLLGGGGGGCYGIGQFFNIHAHWSLYSRNQSGIMHVLMRYHVMGQVIIAESCY